MQDSARRSVDPRFGVNGPRSGGGRGESPKSFHFAVTWTSLSAHLNLLKAEELMLATAQETAAAVEPNQASLAAVAASAVLPVVQKPEARSESSPRWEMVVPKMDRADRVSQALTKAGPYPAQFRDGDVYPTISIPAFASLHTPPPLLTRAMARIGLRSRSLANGRAGNLQVLQLNGPSSTVPDRNELGKNQDAQDRHALRELLLSKITGSLRSRSQGWPQTRMQDDPEESALL